MENVTHPQQPFVVIGQNAQRRPVHGRGLDLVHFQNVARLQYDAGAAFIDINIDDCSSDSAERCEMIVDAIHAVEAAVPIPVSVDSRHADVLKAAVAAADPLRGRLMLNAVSLAQPDTLDIPEAGHHIVVSLLGPGSMVESPERRLSNLDTLLTFLTKQGHHEAAFYVDPLVLPIRSDPRHAIIFCELLRTIRVRYGTRLHLLGGISNISYGMPHRRLLNQAFLSLAMDAGLDAGILDPIHARPDADKNAAHELATHVLLNQPGALETFLA